MSGQPQQVTQEKQQLQQSPMEMLKASLEEEIDKELSLIHI